MTTPLVSKPEGAPEAPARLLSTPPRSLAASLLRWEWFLVILIVVVSFVNSLISPFFLEATNLFRTASDFMELGLMMLPMTFIIITTGSV
ncbi:MAG: hypothetical protein DPW09_31155, partial [Anaerolineae bacterium]|nr:hypothetical protein [Anaerolineae bacterium]